MGPLTMMGPGRSPRTARLQGRAWKVGLKQLLWDVPLVCKSWHRASLTPSCWTNLDIPSADDDVFGSSLSKLIKLMVDRSSGSALKVVLPFYCTLEDLVHISDECPAVRDLTLCFFLATEEVRECVPKVIGKFKELRVLRIYPGLNLEEVITEIGTNCQNFEALVTCAETVGCNVAFAILKYLPNIKYLVLKSGDIPRTSLIHILEGCRNLVLLDVQDCRGFNEDDEEILLRASHIKTFNPRGSISSSDQENFVIWEHLADFFANSLPKMENLWI